MAVEWEQFLTVEELLSPLDQCLRGNQINNLALPTNYTLEKAHEVEPLLWC
jgi:hypothetical protein